MPSHLPPATAGVIVTRAESTISAPASKAWQVLLDFQSYPSWNPFIRSCSLCDDSFRPLPTEQHSIGLGSHFSLKVAMPPSMNKAPNNTTNVLVTAFNPDHCQLCWDQRSYPLWLLRSQRWQVLTQEEREDGGVVTIYETREVFSGLFAWAIKYFLAAKVNGGMSAMAIALKQRVENLP